ncbi:O-methyltransferase [Pararhizobium antarcticum]|nr:class I SAM-dependent methyltransferase [Pararhizobium antarcticum]
MTIDPFSAIQSATRTHRRSHGCGAYTFEDGPALTSMAAASGARRILELGTALGYTACCLAAGHPEARVDTIEGDPDHARLALEQIGSVGLSDRITVHHGDFAAVLPALAGGYGLIFFDGFAPDIIVLEWLTEVLDPGGMLVCANLGLASNRRHLMALLDDTAVWMKEDPIEGGATVVRVKRR